MGARRKDLQGQDQRAILASACSLSTILKLGSPGSCSLRHGAPCTACAVPAQYPQCPPSIPSTCNALGGALSPCRC